ncbi:MAG: TolC family protein [candidate division WOR-3 bacterium]|nr:MAG: TolC family protein [candidate division WOR-3 bacterium]
MAQRSGLPQTAARTTTLAAVLLFAALPGLSAAADIPADTFRLSLAEAIQTALGQSPVSTQAAVTRTDGAITLARGINGMLPSLSGSVDYGWRHVGPDTTGQGWTAGLTVNQVVFSPSAFAGLVSSAVRSAYSSASAHDQQAKLVYDVTVDYLNLLKYSRLKDVAVAALRRASEYLELTREKERRGLASSIDLLRAEAQEAQARLGMLEAEQNLDVGMETFKATAGLGRNKVVVPTEELESPAEFEVSDQESLVAEIERLNPGLRMSAQAKSIARVNQVAAIGSVLPDVSLYWQRSSSGSSLGSCVDNWKDNGTSTYGLRAELPLLDIKSYVLDVVDATNESRRAAAAARMAELQIRSTAASAVGTYLTARQRYDLAAATLTLNERLHELGQQQLRLGAISQVDFLDVEANLVDAQASFVSATCDTYVRAANIAYLLGSSVPAKP